MEPLWTIERSRILSLSVAHGLLWLFGIGGINFGTRKLRQRIRERDRVEEALRESRARLKTTFDAVQAGIVIIDAESHKIIDANPAALDMIGVPKEKVLGSVCHQYICPAEKGHCPITNLGQTVDNSERVLLKANGESVPILKTVVEIELNGRGCLLESFIDITDRKRAEDALQKAHDELEQRVEERTAELQREVNKRKRAQEQIRKSKTMLQEILDGISDPLIMVGKDMLVKVLNRPAAEYYRAELRDVIGKPCCRAFRGRSTPCEGCDIPSAVSSGEASTFERKGIDDPDRFEQVVIYPLKEKDEEGAAIVRISDITEGKLMQRQVIQSEKMASLGLLVSGIAHEINNPNNFITFNIPILRDYLKDMMPILDDHAQVHPDLELFGMSYPEFRKDIFKLLDNVEHGSSRINTIVSDLREFSRRKDKEERRLVDLKPVLEQGVAICRGEIKKKVKFFEVHIPEDLPPIPTDPEALEQVLVNLLINAVHAADKEDSWIRLNVRLGDTPRDHLIIEVSDNGSGLDEKTMGKIFDPFFTTKPVGTGTGLGLFVCHSLIEGLGGRIEVESGEGKGSMFRVILPSLNKNLVAEA